MTVNKAGAVRLLVSRANCRLRNLVLASLAALVALGGCTAATSRSDAESMLRIAVDRSAKLPKAKRIRRPAHDSGEYLRSWGLRAIGADRAYRKGTTGHGVTVAVIDTGVVSAQPEVLRNISPRSTHIIAHRVNRSADSLSERHGGDVSGVLAASLDGAGNVGVACRANVLSIRADLDGSCDTRCTVLARDLARGLDYAVANRAQIIVLALTGVRDLPSAEAALGRAVASGAVIVAAAGNDGADQPGWPARYAADRRFAGSIVVAGATDWNGELVRWSNRAGPTMASYVAAPGQHVVANCATRFCSLVSGTSYATAYVAGALALVMERHPRLNGRQAADLLLRGARDADRKGVDPISGHGTLDVGRAFRLAADRPDIDARS